MLKSALLHRLLRQELPGWVEQGWVAAEHQEAILASVSAGRGTSGRAVPYAFYVLGVILAGTGVIIFLAANWQELSKIIKLGLLFGGMWLAFGLAGVVQARHPDSRHGVNALLLLGVIMFGASIMLIAQIYHIDAHFPNGILTWAAGGMLTAYLMRSQPSMVAALVLALVWTYAERRGSAWGLNEVFHWPFLLFWVACLPAIHRNNWQFALHTAMVSLGLWSWLAIFSFGTGHEALGGTLVTVQLFALAFLALSLLAALPGARLHLHARADMVRRYAMLFAISYFYMLTFPAFHVNAWFVKLALGWTGLGIGLTLAAVGILMALAFWCWRMQREAGGMPADKWGWPLLASVLVLALVGTVLQGGHGNLMAVLFNLLFFAGLVWLIILGYQQRELFAINLGFIFFAIVLLSRYFDTFWSQLARSFFFMSGGLLLAIGGYWMDRKRRQLIRRMDGEQPGAGQ